MRLRRAPALARRRTPGARSCCSGSSEDESFDKAVAAIKPEAAEGWAASKFVARAEAVCGEVSMHAVYNPGDASLVIGVGRGGFSAPVELMLGGETVFHDRHAGEGPLRAGIA